MHSSLSRPSHPGDLCVRDIATAVNAQKCSMSTKICKFAFDYALFYVFEQLYLFHMIYFKS